VGAIESRVWVMALVCLCEWWDIRLVQQEERVDGVLSRRAASGNIGDVSRHADVLGAAVLAG